MAMNKCAIARTWLVLLFLLPLFTAFAQKTIPPRPNPPRLVNDFIGLLNDAEREALERKLLAYNDSTSTQVAIVIESTLNGADIFTYSNTLAQEWGIGQADRDNGILIYIAFNDRKLFIQTGYGVEGFLPDALAKRIVDNVIVPSFREQQYYTALDRATSMIFQLGSGEYVNDLPGKSSFPIEVIIFIIIFIIFIIIIIARSNKGNNDGGYYRGGNYENRGGGWMVFPGGGWNTGGGGGWNTGGGGGGGGFGGFGGGDFGGGGAGGSW
jgi:uncharacterized protein